jgi:ubiquitin-conjugating enzyme E2 G1
MALKRLTTEYKTIKNEPNYLYSICPSEESILKWDFIMIGPPDTFYEGGLFNGNIIFTETYPLKPPRVIFKNMIHPNIHVNGEVCISILHEGTDSYGYEKDFERWSPSHGIESIMMSIISMLSDPNFESPANLDMSILWKNKPEEYKQSIYKLVSNSQK